MASGDPRRPSERRRWQSGCRAEKKPTRRPHIRPVCRGLVGGPTPNQLGVDCNAHVIEAVLSHIAEPRGWRQPQRRQPEARGRRVEAGCRDVQRSRQNFSQGCERPGRALRPSRTRWSARAASSARRQARRAPCAAANRGATISSMDAPSARPSIRDEQGLLGSLAGLARPADVAPTGPRGRRPRPLPAGGATPASTAATAAPPASMPRASRPAAVIRSRTPCPSSALRQRRVECGIGRGGAVDDLLLGQPAGEQRGNHLGRGTAPERAGQRQQVAVRALCGSRQQDRLGIGKLRHRVLRVSSKPELGCPVRVKLG